MYEFPHTQMSMITLTPKLQIQEPKPAPERPPITLGGVLTVKFLRWIDGASSTALGKALLRCLTVIAIALLVFAPNVALRAFLGVFRWHSYRIPIFLVAVSLTLNAKRLYRSTCKKCFGPKGSNQNNYHGIPIGEIATFLLQSGGFKREVAMKKFGLSQGQYAKIASELDEHSILMRGENNARVLRPIEREMLVTQLRDKFPYAWSDERDTWYEKNGTFERWAISQDFKQRKLTETIEKKERKLDRLEEGIRDAKQTTFATLFPQ
jgi:hypothetical protein